MKNRSFSICLVLAIMTSLTYGQVTEAEKRLRTQTIDTTKGWKTGGVLSVNLAQTSLKNWAAGGENSVAINGLFNVFANYKDKNTAWDNSLGVGYGFLQQGTKSSKKTDDKIDFVSIYGRKAAKSLYYSALVNFKTQMTAGYNYLTDTSKIKISDYFAPAYLTVALGMDYKPNAYFNAFLAPLTGKFTFVTNKTLSDAGAFGVTHGEKILSEFGGYVRIVYSRNDFKAEILKNVSFTTKVDLFSNYLKNPQNVVVNWETLLAFKVNKYLAVTFNTLLIYDDKIKIGVERTVNGVSGVFPGPRVQFKEILGVGFAYNF
jgi:hypothetical protein